MPNQTYHQNEMPALTPDRNVETGVVDSFPASDPPASTASQGARAVPPEEMMDNGEGSQAPNGSVTISARFRDREAAKLALESLVREGPLDRRHAELVGADDDEVTLHFQAPQQDVQRLEQLVQKQGGATVS
jgi:hypothetical protein